MSMLLVWVGLKEYIIIRLVYKQRLEKGKIGTLKWPKAKQYPFFQYYGKDDALKTDPDKEGT